MIGVIAPQNTIETVREFFQLFKTPWEPWESGRPYEILLVATDGQIPDIQAKLVLQYSGRKLPSDAPDAIQKSGDELPITLKYDDDPFPIYGDCVLFSPGDHPAYLAEPSSGRPAACRRFPDQHRQIFRIGYDLFQEVQTLLSRGQPADHAGTPTLDLHIELLRNLIRCAGIGFMEIPPLPCDYEFMVCLTHDVDHPAVRMHLADHTAAGFLYRATIASLAQFISGRISISTLLSNWSAAAKWPFVQMHLARDFWADFPRRYHECEGTLPSTYFVIPYMGKTGRSSTGIIHKRRAAGYGAVDIRSTIDQLLDHGSEIGLHGIDAWCDTASALAELDVLRHLTSNSKVGVRMHWLFFDNNSPQILERAGANYDSTVGYRETVGYRTGTTQAYVPLGAESLIELPLHAMDVSLFYPAYLGLTSGQAVAALTMLVRNAVRFGGCLTINWHDRSLAPERLWTSSYQQLLKTLQTHKVWFATCTEAAAWFRKRRSVVFRTSSGNTPKITCQLPVGYDALPGLVLRTHIPKNYDPHQHNHQPQFYDAPLAQETGQPKKQDKAGEHGYTSSINLREPSVRL